MLRPVPLEPVEQRAKPRQLAMQLGGGLARLGQLRPLAFVSSGRQVALDLVEVRREFVGQSFDGVANVFDDELQERCHTWQTALAFARSSLGSIRPSKAHGAGR